MEAVTKHGVRCDAYKEFVKQMFNRVVYVLMALEYDVGMENLRSYKAPLAIWV